MDSDDPFGALMLELLLFVLGAALAGSGGYGLYGLARERPRSGWQRTSGEVVGISTHKAPPAMGPVPFSTRVEYTYTTLAGPQRGMADLPPGVAVHLGQRLPIDVHPVRLDRSALTLPAHGRGRRYAAALLEFAVGLALVVYVVLAVSGAFTPDLSALFAARVGLVLGGLATAAAAKALRGKPTADSTQWTSVHATVERVERPREDTKGWFVAIAYEYPDGVRRTGCGIYRTGDKPTHGLDVRIHVDPERPGRFRFP